MSSTAETWILADIRDAIELRLEFRLELQGGPLEPLDRPTVDSASA